MKLSLHFLKILSIAMICLGAFSCTTKEGNILLDTRELKVKPLGENTFVHVSYLKTNDFGYVACNGMIYKNGSEVIVFDTPTNDSISTLLINWIQDSLQAQIKAIVPGHFHEDCLGGLNAFHEAGIPSYANFQTIELALRSNSTAPENGFNDSLTLNIGNEKVNLMYFGEGHTGDNIVGYIPSENTLFGGCLIKCIGAKQGYIGDANVNAWSTTVNRIKTKYPNLTHVVPGHGPSGDHTLLDYTINLFAKQ